MLKQRKALGYTEVLVQEPCLLGNTGSRLRGHEFHYSEIVDYREQEPLSTCYELQARHGKATVLEGFRVGSVLASYVHVHFGSNFGVAGHWVEACRCFRDHVDARGGSGGTAC